MRTEFLTSDLGTGSGCFLAAFFLRGFWSIFGIVGAVPTQSVDAIVAAGLAPAARTSIAPDLVRDLFRTCEAAAYALSQQDFEQILLRIGMADNFGRASGTAAGATREQQAAFFAALKLADLVLARACASGHERAWEHFIALYRLPLLRAAIVITGSETLGRELADGLYAELYGLTVRAGERLCPLESYRGRGSLIGWLRTTLAQRHVDHHRRTHREQPLDEVHETETVAAEAHADAAAPVLPLLTDAVKAALQREEPEERFLLASYYLDGRTLQQIAALLGVHEATVSRKLKRAAAAVRKRIIRTLERQGMSRRAAEEALAVDPRDLTGPCDRAGPSQGQLRLKELLQAPGQATFHEQVDPKQTEP